MITSIFVAYDPGNTTGVAWYDPIDGTFNAYQHADPINCWFWAQNQIDVLIDELDEETDFIEPHFTVEDYVGGGYRNTDSILTLKRVGYFETRISEYWGQDEWVDLRVVGSNMRKSGLRLAAELLDTTSIPGPHTLDALSHAIVHSRQV